MTGADLTGQKFTRLLVIERDGTQNNKRLWRCLCDCGKTVFVTTGGLRSGNTKSCGCWKYGIHTKHGLHRTRTYRLWQAMLNRCRQKQYEKYYRDILVCDQWKTFEGFLKDMGPCPDGLSLDRINNNGNYEPGNCRWTDRKTQSRNTRRRKEFELNGVSRSLLEWAEYTGMPFERLRKRIRDGWSIEDAITTN